MINFTKMHGLGNDFVVIDCTRNSFDLPASEIQRMGDRRRGVGFDQLLVVSAATIPGADFQYRIFNADGFEVEQCGNGARCVARFIHDNKLAPGSRWTLQTKAGEIDVILNNNDEATAVLGVPRWQPDQIPLLADTQASIYPFDIDGQRLELAALSVGNPHAVMCVPDINSVPVAQWGERIAQHPNFPEGVNVGFMQYINSTNIRLQVYERGVGLTAACGTGASAAVAVGRRWGLLDERVCVQQTGGDCEVFCSNKDQRLSLTGPVAVVFTGEWSLPVSCEMA